MKSDKKWIIAQRMHPQGHCTIKNGIPFSWRLQAISPDWLINVYRCEDSVAFSDFLYCHSWALSTRWWTSHTWVCGIENRTGVNHFKYRLRIISTIGQSWHRLAQIKASVELGGNFNSPSLYYHELNYFEPFPSIFI